MKPSRLNATLDHLSKIKIGEEPTNIEEGLSDAQLFKVDVADDYYDQIIQFLATGVAPADFSTIQKKRLVVKASNFQLLAQKLYKLGPDEILRRCVLPHEQGKILEKAHVGITGEHYGERAMTRKVLHVGL